MSPRFYFLDTFHHDDSDTVGDGDSDGDGDEKNGGYCGR